MTTPQSGGFLEPLGMLGEYTDLRSSTWNETAVRFQCLFLLFFLSMGCGCQASGSGLWASFMLFSRYSQLSASYIQGRLAPAGPKAVPCE